MVRPRGDGAHPQQAIRRQASRARLCEKISHQARHGFSKWAVTEKASGKLIGERGVHYFEGRPGHRAGLPARPGLLGPRIRIRSSSGMPGPKRPPALGLTLVALRVRHGQKQARANPLAAVSPPVIPPGPSRTMRALPADTWTLTDDPDNAPGHQTSIDERRRNRADLPVRRDTDGLVADRGGRS